MTKQEKDFYEELKGIAKDLDNLLKLRYMISDFNLSTAKELKNYINEQKNIPKSERDIPVDKDLMDAINMIQFAENYGLKGDPVEDFVNGILEIKYTRSLGYEGITDIIMVLGTGGPHIELSLAEHAVEGWWGDMHLTYYVDSEICDVFWDYISELIPREGC